LIVTRERPGILGRPGVGVGRTGARMRTGRGEEKLKES